ncbi:hypothetical protein Xcel_0553 [Xylanimonas cellulosilytica DSM 15894]|uniref:Uncharacterized protein n=1 Tax=Xylanimonas cellulosilytica (strain DSM 15894 / JCM 12276 / CECT 5975 / KCTC 9989 / LMG 20990 / NBRC 107835 / XIL07) TaxID=446471 RepID=D1BWL0_XYLCX|nr:hypothetical protein [Xylanimonas cellulosilytica]ACZ29592.1 hypothetical protein Xcel_0553 [Xylanimonas cellulosilytica DSM 15894]
MSDLDLDAIRGRAEAATPGPWRHAPAIGNGGRYVSHCVETADRETLIADRLYGPTAKSIAHARQDIPALLAELRRLSAWKAEAVEVLNAYQRLAERVVPNPTLGRRWSDMLAEHVDRQAAALAEVTALADLIEDTLIPPRGEHAAPSWDSRYWAGADDASEYIARKLRAILARAALTAPLTEPVTETCTDDRTERTEP